MACSHSGRGEEETLESVTLILDRPGQALKYPSVKKQITRQAARQRSLLSSAVVLHTIAVPLVVTPVSPATEQNDPG